MSPFDHLFRIMTKPSVIVLYFGLIALLIFYFDMPIANYFYKANLRADFPYLSLVTRLGLGSLYFPIFIFSALFFRYIYKNIVWEARAWFLLLCLTIPTVVCLSLKIILGRARPNLYLQGDGYAGFYGFKLDANFWSFPSGHTTTIMAVILGLVVLFPRYFAILLSLGIGVAFSRVLLTHHYLSDVLFSSYLALLEIALLLCFLQHKSWLAPAWKSKYND